MITFSNSFIKIMKNPTPYLLTGLLLTVASIQPTAHANTTATQQSMQNTTTPVLIESRYLHLDNDKQLDEVRWIKTENNDYKLQLNLSSEQQPKLVSLITQDTQKNILPTSLMINDNILIVGFVEQGEAKIDRQLKLRLNKQNNKIQLIGYDDRYTLEGSFFANWTRSFNLITGDSIAKYYDNDWQKTRIHASKKYEDMSPIYLDEIADNMIQINKHLNKTMGIAKLLSIRIS